MNSENEKQTPEYLHISGTTVYGGAPRISRHPLVYTKAGAEQINLARLPEHQDMLGMELAYRQQSGIAGLQTASGIVGMLTVWSFVFPVLAILVPKYLPVEYGIGISAVIAFLILLGNLSKTGLDPLLVVRLLIFAPSVVGITYWFGMLFRYRLIGAAVLGLIAIVAYLRFARIPFDYYSQWAHAHPRLRPETRRQAEAIKRSPNYTPLLVSIAIALVVPAVSNTLAIAAVLGVAIGFGYRMFLPSRVRQARKVLSVFIGFKGRYRVPGLWYPKWPKSIVKITKRLPAHLRNPKPVGVLALLVFPFTLSLSVGMSLFAIWDVPVVGIAAVYNLNIDVADRVLLGPTAWIQDVVPAISQGNFWLMWVFPIALVLGLLIPPLLLMAIFGNLIEESLAIDRKIDGYKRRDGSRVPGLDEDERTEWQWYLDRINQSNHSAIDSLGVPVQEASHIFLGIEPFGDFPVLLDRSALSEHCYIVGETGSGKTALGIQPIISQLIRNHRVPSNGGEPEQSERPPIIILDLKGDLALFHTMRNEAKMWADKTGENLNDIFRFFTPEQNKASFYFNPLDDFYSGERSLQQLASLLLESLNLSHGEGYGRSYFTRRNRQLLYAALEKGRAAGNPPKHIDDLYELIYELSREPEYKDASELVATLHSLSRYKLLAPGPEHRDWTIHMPEVLERRQIAYFWLPAAIESVSVREIGKMAVYSLLTAAIARQQQGLDYRQCYLVIDEFQRLAAENFKVILEQARSFGIANILANQTKADLNTPDSDLRPTIHTNTRVKLHFSVTDPQEVKDLSGSSGEEIAVMTGQSFTTGGQSSTFTRSYNDAIKPRLTKNDIMRVSDHPLEFILQLSRGSGYTQFGGAPIPVRTTWPLNFDVYKQRSRAPWPTLADFPDDSLGQEDTAPLEQDAIAEEEKLRRQDLFRQAWERRRGESTA